MNKPTIGLLEYAIMVLTTVTGLFLTFKLPVLGVFVLSLGGIPAFILSISRNKLLLPYAVLAFVTSWSLTSWASALVLVPLVFMPAIFLATALKLGFTPLKAVSIALLSATLFSTGFWTITNGIYGTIPSKELLAENVRLIEVQLDKVEKENPENIEYIDNARKNFLIVYEYTSMLIPVTLLFVWHLVTIWIYYLGASKLSLKLGYKITEFPPFTEWQFNWNIIWLYMAGLFFYHYLAGIDWGVITGLVKAIGANCLAISTMLYYIAGLSLLFFMLDKYKAGFYTRFFMSFLALFFAQIIVWFGIIDVWADFRKPKPVSSLSDSDDSESDLF